MKKHLVIIPALILLLGVIMTSSKNIDEEANDYVNTIATLESNTYNCGGGTLCVAEIAFDSPHTIDLEKKNFVPTIEYLNGTPAWFSLEWTVRHTTTKKQCDDVFDNVTQQVITDCHDVRTYTDDKILTKGMNTIVLWSDKKPSYDTVDWNFVIDNIDLKEKGIMKNATFNTRNKKWATWGANSLVAYWAFDNTSWANQSSTNLNHLIKVNSIDLTSGIIGSNASLFNAAGDYMLVNITMQPTYINYTVNMWVNLTSIDLYDELFRIYDNSPDVADFLTFGDCGGASDAICFYAYAASGSGYCNVSFTSYKSKNTMITIQNFGNSSGYNGTLFLNGQNACRFSYTRAPITGAISSTIIGNCDSRAQTRAPTGVIDDFLYDNQVWNSTYIETVYQMRANYLNITGGFSNDTAVANSCTWSGSGAWVIQGTDLCNITTNTTVTSSIVFNGTGQTSIFANITATSCNFTGAGPVVVHTVRGRLTC